MSLLFIQMWVPRVYGPQQPAASVGLLGSEWEAGLALKLSLEERAGRLKRSRVGLALSTDQAARLWEHCSWQLSACPVTRP